MPHRFLRAVFGLVLAALVLGAGAVPAAAVATAGAGVVSLQSLDDPPVDSDGDGIPDDTDQCPFEPGVPENYGCPYLGPVDSDGDGVNDDTDLCPSDPGSPAYNGCPVPDSDGDGLTDDVDACPDQPGPYDGCPLTDLDGDGVYDDGSDLCPNEPGLPEYNGCPAPDSDGDGVVDDADGCPGTPQGENVDAAGCSLTQLDSDNDGVNDEVDQCDDTPADTPIDDVGCSLPVVTAKPPTFADRCGKGQDTVTVPTSTGVVYRRGANVVAAGTYRVKGTVTIVAESADGYVLSGVTEWTSVMTNKVCPRGRIILKSPARGEVRIANREEVSMTIWLGSNARKLGPGEVRTLSSRSGTFEWSARWKSSLIRDRSGSVRVR